MALLLLVCAVVSAQTAIKGKVLDGSLANEPMIGASVQVSGTSTGAVTDVDGNFSFTLPPGQEYDSGVYDRI